MKKIMLVLLVILSAFSFAAEKLVVGMELEYPPFETIDTNGNPSGVSIDMAKSLGESLGREVVIENMSYAGLIPALLSGKIDAIISSMTINEQRAKKVDFSDAYTTSQLVMLANIKSDVQSFKDLNSSDIKVAVKAGTASALWLDANAPKAEAKSFDKETQAILDVSQGKSDIFIYDPLAVVRHNKKYPDTTRTIMDPLPNVGGWGVAIRKGQPELLENINTFIKEAKVDGTFDQIREKYLKEEAASFENETGLKFFF